MDVRTFLIGFALICSSLLLSTIHAQDVCVQKSPCSCEYSNGTGIDLSESAKATFFTAQIFQTKNNGTLYEMSTYYYHPCFDVVPSVNSSSPGSTCSDPLSICRHINSMNQTTTIGTFEYHVGIYEFMGSSKITNITNTADGLAIIYNNGPSDTIVLLVCAESEDKLHIHSLADPKNIELSFYSRNACLRQLESPGRSVGSTLVIIFFSLVIFYLVLGICTKKFLMGATGIEIVPNLAFWNDLPNLVKDGWAFTLNGFKLPARGTAPATSPDPNSYDSI